MDRERLWTDTELDYILKTFVTLRKMRTAALQEKLPFNVQARNLAARILRGPVTEKKGPQAVLNDAERLGILAADFLAGRLTDNIPEGEDPTEWGNFLRKSDPYYKDYAATTFARSSLMNSVGNSIIGRLRHLAMDPEYMLKWDLTINNNLGAKNVKALVKNPPAVIAPLSGDYFFATVYAKFLKLSVGRGFKVRAAIIGAEDDRVIIPMESGAPAFINEPRIALYIDTSETGRTGRVLEGVVKAAHPNSEVLPPNTEDTLFMRSPVVEKFYDSLPPRD